MMRLLRLHKEIAKSKSHEIALDVEAAGPSSSTGILPIDLRSIIQDRVRLTRVAIL